MNEQRIEEIKNAIREMVQALTQRGQPLTDDIRQQIVRAMEHAATRITQLRQEESLQIQPEQPPQEPIAPTAQPQAQPLQPRAGPPPAPAAQLLWILSGQNPESFLQYIQTYPDPSLNSLLQNQGELQRTIEYLNQMMPPGAQPLSPEGIPHADLNSSNIYGFQYDPKSGRLKVRFQGGSVYSYDGVPANVFQAFKSGAISAKTSGQNQYGRWWVGKNPSLGASFYQLIRQGGYPYQRIS